MVLDFADPEFLAGEGIERVFVGAAEGPVNAAGMGVQGVDGAVVAADEEASVDHADRGPCGGGIGETEGPFEDKVRDLFSSESGVFGGLEAGVRDVGAPAIP